MSARCFALAAGLAGFTRLATGLAWAVVVAGVAVASVAAPAAAADREAGRVKAKTCIACHDEYGMSARPDAPHLAGQVEMYLATQLRAYRSGARKSEIMKIIAAPLTDEDIDNLAAWYAGIRVVVEPEGE